MQEIRRTLWTSLVIQIVLLSILSCLILRGSAQSSPPSSSPSQAPNPSTIVTNRSEAVALLRLRGDLGIRKAYWPRRADPCLSWKGIQCDEGHIVGIELAGLRRTVRRALQPTFSLDALPRFPFLRNLNASGFPLAGVIPDWFGQLSNLQVLDFTSASINGTIPSSIGGLSNLTILRLAQNHLTGGIPSNLGELNNLASLDLSFNRLNGSIPVTVVNLRNLTLVNLSSNSLMGSIPSGIGNLTQLQGLILASNHLTGFIPNELGDLFFLSRVDLGSNALSGPIPVEIGRLAVLNILILSNNSLNGSIPTDIINCTELQVLSLGHNNLTGTLPTMLGLLKKLSNLDLSFNSLTGVLSSGISTLLEVEAIVLSHNLLYGPLPAGLISLPKLMTLDLSYNYFNGSLSGANVSNTLLEENCLSRVGNQRTFETCQSFYSARGISFHGIIGVPPAAAGGNSPRKNKHLRAILGGVFGGLGLVFIVIIIVVFVLKQERRKEATEREPGSASQKGGPRPLSVNLFSLGEQFSYSQLQQATGEFGASNLLKAGHSGDLYQGLFEGGVPIVVKRIDLSRFRKDAYLAELELFGKASHTRLVPLLGHCLEREEEKLLVYKYMPNRDLAYALHRRTTTSLPEDTLQSLDWITRLKIAIGAAEGLAYLHHECTPPLAHRDVQASSILLDDKFEVRLGSLTEACAAEGEAHHGVIARILRISQPTEQGDPGAPSATCSSDVYCFGKVLLELVSGRLGISGLTDPSAEAWLDWALPLISIYDKESLTKLVDPSLIVDEDLLEEVWAMAIVAKSCLNPKPSKRPLMKYILKALENPLKVVREDTVNGSRRSRASSHNSWNAAFFGSWRHSSSETVAIPGSLREEHVFRSGSKRLGNGGSRGSQGSGQGEVSHRRLGSNEIFPEPVEELLVQAAPTDSEMQES